MALITCKDCGKQFSTDAKKCPNCGAKAPYRWTWWRITLAALVVLPIVIMVVTPSDPARQADFDKAYEQGIARSKCERAIKDRLKAPATAKFEMTQAGRNDRGTYAVIGYVDAENSYGAMLRSVYGCELAGGGDSFTVISADLAEK